MFITGLDHLKLVRIPHLPKQNRKKQTVTRYAVVQKLTTLDGTKVIAIIRRKRRKNRRFSLQFEPRIKISVLEMRI